MAQCLLGDFVAGTLQTRYGSCSAGWSMSRPSRAYAALRTSDSMNWKWEMNPASKD
jgi:hypothetical protein